ncbi:hypothetical protein [Nonomuraea sp. NPDC049709]|uniref:hypothetical protein n=1 Tax=Nonomuraea sp. NPDC049709 TaxID=3154736 RepID=UPI00342D389F
MSWINQAINQHTALWLLLSSLIGGVVGAAVTFLFQDLLRPWLTGRRDARRVLSRYTMPLLRSAERLETRINILVRNADRGWYASDEYYRVSTLYSFGEYLGWIRNIEREFAFVRLESGRRSREFTKRFNGLFRAMSSFSYFRWHPDPDAVSASEVPRLMCAGIGEVMTSKEGTDDVLDFSEFVDRWGSGPEFTRWFRELDAVLRRAEQADALCGDRLILAAANLRALITLLDPKQRMVDRRPLANLDRLHHDALRQRLLTEFPVLAPPPQPAAAAAAQP